MFVNSITRRINIVVLASALLAVCSTIDTTSARAAPTVTVRYVAPSGVDAGDCSASGSPCKNIQYAVDHSVSSDTIKVAAGTYYFLTNACTFYFTSSVLCYINKNLIIRGGYTTSDWTNPNPTTNVTVIDGESLHRGVAVYSDTAATLDMEGFTIQYCNTVGPTTTDGGDPTGYGGGMYAVRTTLTLRDMTFTNNQVAGQANPSSGIGGTAAGAGLSINGAPPGSTSLLQRVTFGNNHSQGGVGSVRGGIAYGAIYAVGSNVTVQDSFFTNNAAIGGNSSGLGTDGNQAYGLGAAIAFERDPNSPYPASLTLTRLTITGNRGVGGNAGTFSGAQGGGAHGAIFSENGTSFVLSDSYVYSNTLVSGTGYDGGYSYGGGISILNTPVTIDRTSIISNTIRGGNTSGGGTMGGAGGGGMFIYRGADAPITATLTNAIFADNLVDGGTSGISSGGGGIQIQGLSATLTHVTFAQNRLGSNLVLGQAMRIVESSVSRPATVIANNSLIANHTVGGTGAAAVVVQTSNSITFNGGLFAANTKDTNNNNSPVAKGTINGLNTMQSIITSAGFASPGSPNYNYHLLNTSPAIDQASNFTPLDIDMQSRPYPYPNGTSDFGADEYTGPPPVLTPRSYLPFIIR